MHACLGEQEQAHQVVQLGRFFVYVYRSTVCQVTVMFLHAAFSMSHFDISQNTIQCYDGRGFVERSRERHASETAEHN